MGRKSISGRKNFLEFHSKEKQISRAQAEINFFDSVFLINSYKTSKNLLRLTTIPVVLFEQMVIIVNNSDVWVVRQVQNQI